MLSSSEFNILALIDRLQTFTSETGADDQVKVVTDELAKLRDEVESSELILPTLPVSHQTALKLRLAQQKDFIDLGFRRLRTAQLTAEQVRRRRWEEEQRKQEMPLVKKAETTGRSEAAGDVTEAEKDAHLAKSEDITATLRRIHQMAQGEVIKSDLNVGELDMSSRTLRKLQEKYSSADILLNGSRKLIQILDEADTWDRRKMLASLSLLGAVLLWIIWRRILHGPVAIMLWGLLRLVGLAKFVSSPLRSTGEIAAVSLEPTLLNTLVSTVVATTSIPTGDIMSSDSIHADL